MSKEAFKKITSVENVHVKHWVRLRQNKSYREEVGSVLVSGKKMVKEISSHIKPLSVIVLEGEAPISHDNLYSVSLPVLKKITGLTNPEPIAAEFPLPKPLPLDKKDKILVLDRIADPGNLGTLVRSAIALGFEGLFILKDTCDLFNEKSLRAARGASFFFPFFYGSFDDLFELAEKNGHTIYIANTKGKDIKNITPPKKILLVLSNEAQGVSANLKNKGQEITIPMSSMESLNVATAGAILMYCLHS